MRTRPRLYVSYSSEMSLLPTWTQKIAAFVFLGLLALIPFGVIPGLGFLADNDWLKILSRVAIFAIGALGLHILSGLAGQVSLGHAFFVGIGAYTAAVLGGESASRPGVSGCPSGSGCLLQESSPRRSVHSSLRRPCASGASISRL